jgi:glucose-1-phosphate adenylyltransferase
MPRVLGLVNLHNTPDLGEITENRSFGSLTFLGRYSFVDLPLSNFANSNINQTAILIKDYIRSIIRHMDTSQTYSTNTKIGYDYLLYNEKYANNSFYNTDINNLKENIWMFKEHQFKYVIVAPAHIIYKLDFNELINQHKNLKSEITCVYSHITNGKSNFIGGDTFEIDKQGLLKGITKNNGVKDDIDVSLETYVISISKLKDMIEFATQTSAFFTLRDVIKYVCSTLKVDTYEYKGYLRRIASIEDYMAYSMELLDGKLLEGLTNLDWPIYTKTHDTPPARYLEDAVVKNSIISNGATVDGEVSSSIICREVIINKGAKVSNSIIFSGAEIGENVVMDHVIVDKDAKVIHKKELYGTKEKPLYIKQGDVI